MWDGTKRMEGTSRDSPTGWAGPHWRHDRPPPSVSSRQRAPFPWLGHSSTIGRPGSPCGPWRVLGKPGAGGDIGEEEWPYGQDQGEMWAGQEGGGGGPELGRV